MNFLKDYPNKEELISWFNTNASAMEDVKVNAHIHTPYSFSAFKDIPQIFELAVKENVQVLGINDFYTTAGYEEFYQHAVKNKVFPLFNIEYIGLNAEDQKNGVRVNDPNNPGRTYFSGKGLAFPAILEEPFFSKMEVVLKETLNQVVAMIDKTNVLLNEIDAGFQLSMDEIMKDYAKGQVRERHIAKVLRIKAYEKYTNDEEKRAFFQKLFGGKAVSSSLDDNSSLENEIRGNLLKAGGKAFVEEDPKAFLDVEEVKQIILHAGGIPTYPLLADDKNGGYTDFEENKETLLKTLLERGIYSIEFIPGRNGLELLKEYASFFWNKGIVVTFGTEHNTPELIPLTVDTRGGVDLDDELKAISFKGACVTAAHQYLVAQGEEGYVDAQGNAKMDKREDFVLLGQAVLAKYFA